MKLWPLAMLGLIVVMIALLLGAVAPEDETALPDDDAVLLQMDGRIGDLELEAEHDQIYVVVHHNGEKVRLTAAQYIQALADTREHQRDRGFLFVLFNITTWFGVLWVAVGLGGQALFTGRMVLQWLASERLGRSVVPPMFWWLSLIGATMLIMYFLWRKDIVGVLGQSTGWFVYVRNIWMIHSRGLGAADQTNPAAQA